MQLCTFKPTTSKVLSYQKLFRTIHNLEKSKGPQNL